MHVWSKDILEAVDGARLGVEVCEGAVVGLPISLDKAVDVKGIDIVEEGTILQRLG